MRAEKQSAEWIERAGADVRACRVNIPFSQTSLGSLLFGRICQKQVSKTMHKLTVGREGERESLRALLLCDLY